ncbi:MAG: bifunctional diaminohydroxyphosphoribosylaminopyrimidine deaminase/5-amino-6-(5-phosphoribosylamino)uracil reductase RibD [Gemmataceae bacterium]|nr:bifunctional diaminohydroxyphosphoribosylaminopyrimidine deaminase/5-amino-6-(5-phosphoribosylamino)uracil reductase RibD [Gemmataceae bacterium]MCI0737669.1 bifunctional diaminohydroxyphosphoribosylaminopyrimidine deaminase/5-amino-6-(5-phosphoribosylamino)uracil reductase RibD [Gemmataceae bacterium]
MLAIDEKWMRRALEIAERGRGHVEPNPLVGCVLERDGQVVGEGWHEKFGQAHAEINALKQAKDRALGATCFVTLEPCCHHGKTPPCTETLVKAGVARVVAALEDPYPEVAGRSAAKLRESGIPVDFGLCADEARRQNAPYLKLVATGKPYIHAKWAMTLDGKIASRTGDSKWISSEASRRKVHELRGRMDAILVGIGTALADDPLLTARPPGARVAARVVLDTLARLPVTSKLAQTAAQAPTVVAVSVKAASDQTQVLADAGCQIWQVSEEFGRLDIDAVLKEMGKRRWTNILVEGGSEVLGSFLDAGAIDEVHVFLAARLLGGALARTPIAGHGLERIADSCRFVDWDSEQIEEDIYLRAWR